MSLPHLWPLEPRDQQPLVVVIIEGIKCSGCELSSRHSNIVAIAGSLLDLRQEEHSGADAKESACQQTQPDVALAPAEELRATIQRHRNHGDHPHPPGEVWHAPSFPQEGERYSCQQHARVDGQATLAEADLIAKDEEGMSWQFVAEEAIHMEDRAGWPIETKGKGNRREKRQPDVSNEEAVHHRQPMLAQPPTCEFRSIG